MLKLWFGFVAVVAATLVAVLSWVFTYSGGYSPPPERPTGVEDVTLPSYAVSTAPEVTADRAGVMVVDTLHFNHFLQGELEPLLSKVTRLGYDVNFFGDRLAVELNFNEFQRAAELEEALREADSLLVIAPIIEYSSEETEVVRRFVDKGGKLLLAGDPTRVKRTNSLATALGINYEDDFLYNVAEHEANYRNVFFRDFAPHPVTGQLSTIVLYTASSITGEAEPLITADSNTRSSRREGTTTLSPMVLALDGRVLAIGDTTFIRPPFNEVLDNDQFLLNLAEFLTTSERRFDLEDFPFFLGDEVDVVMAGDRVLSQATRTAQLLSTGDRRAQLTTLERSTVDTVFVGLFDDLDQVSHHLSAGDITLAGGQLSTPFTPDMPQQGSGVLFLDTSGGSHVLVAMASSEVDLDTLIRLLETGQFRSGLVSPNLGLYQLSQPPPPRFR